VVNDISTAVIEQYRQARLSFGVTASNRQLELLRHLFNWATSKARRLAPDNPFLDGAKPAIRALPEQSRQRRLQKGEREALLAACSPHLWPIVQCALETGMRLGEILSVQWAEVRLTPTGGEIALAAAKTKTRRGRTIPISATLRAVLAMRRTGPDGEEHRPSAYVFGDEVGARVKTINRTWRATVLRAHGYTPQYVLKTVGEGGEARQVRTGSLTAECRAQLRAIDLHFHDLRREAGSRWLDGGVPLHRVQRWLGHTNISQTSTYLLADAADDGDAMKRFEAAQMRLQQIATGSGTGHHNVPRTTTGQDSEAPKTAENLH
jgi:integrase